MTFEEYWNSLPNKETLSHDSKYRAKDVWDYQKSKYIELCKIKDDILRREIRKNSKLTQALEEIAGLDFRGNRPEGSVIAYNTLKKLKDS